MSDTQSLITSNDQNEKVDDRVFFALQERVGSMGNYQKATVALWCIVAYLCGGLMLITPYLFYQDPYDCGPGYSEKQCYDQACGTAANDRDQYINPNPTMISLANQFGDFRCPDEKLKLDFIITLMYIGNVAGFLGLTLVGDMLGRKMLMFVNLCICALGMTITIFCANLTMAGIGLFISTCGVQNAFNVCFYYISQTVSESHRQKFSVAIQLFYGLGVLINVLWFYAVGNWQIILAVFYFVPLILAAIGVFFFVKDTPICLVTRYTPSVAVKHFHFIAKINKKTDFELTIDDVSTLKRQYNAKLTGDNTSSKKKTFSIIDLFRFKSLRFMTLMCILLQCTIIFQFYAPALMLDQFQLNIFINGLVIGVSEIIAYPLCYYMITRVKRRFVAYGCFALTFVCSLILTFVWKEGQNDETPDIGSSIGVLSLIFLFRFAISVEYTYFYVYFNELYPTQVRVLGTGLVSTMGGVMVTIAPQILDVCIGSGFPVMVLFVVLSGLSGFFSSRLPQTLGAAPQDEIEQLRELKMDEVKRSQSTISSDSLVKTNSLSKKSTSITISQGEEYTENPQSKIN